MSMALFIVTFREGFEALLLTSILFTLFMRGKNRTAAFYVIGGAFAAVLASAAFSYVAAGIYRSFDGMGQNIFQAALLITASLVIATVVVFLGQNHAAGARAMATKYAGRWGVLGAACVSFIMVFREGVEMALFLGAMLLSKNATAEHHILMALSGILAAFLLTGVISVIGFKLPIKVFFTATSAFLIFLAAGMASAGTGKLIEIEWLPPIRTEIWNTAWLLDESRFPGNLLAALIGYNANPSLMEALVYIFTLTLLVSLYMRQTKGGMPGEKHVRY